MLYIVSGGKKSFINYYGREIISVLVLVGNLCRPSAECHILIAEQIGYISKNVSLKYTILLKHSVATQNVGNSFILW